MNATVFAVLGICATVSFVPAVYGQPTPTASTCQEIPYPPPTPKISLSVDPTPPILGGTVTLSFHVLTFPNGPPSSVRLAGAAPVFAVNGQTVTSYFYGADAVYTAVVAQAGTAQLVLSFDSEIAYGCVDRPVYAFRQFLSDPFAVEVIEATPTRTPSASPTTTCSPTPPAIGCVGDCNSDAEVTVDEIIIGVNMALGNVAANVCPAFICCVGQVCTTDVSCIVGALDNALDGCPATRAMTPTPTVTP